MLRSNVTWVVTAAFLAASTACSSSSSSTSSNCSALQTCCASSTFPSTDLSACNVVVQGDVDSVCVTSLADYTQAGSCGSSGTDAGGCASKAQTVSYDVSGSCGASGRITLSVFAGACNLTVLEDQTVPLPMTGAFTAKATQTDFDLTEGNWTLGKESQTSSGLQCTISAVSASSIDLTCTIDTCEETDDDIECGATGACDATLTQS